MDCFVICLSIQDFDNGVLVAQNIYITTATTEIITKNTDQ